MNTNGSATKSVDRGDPHVPAGQILPGHENKPLTCGVPCAPATTQAGSTGSFWTDDRKLFAAVALVILLGSGLAQGYSNDWHWFSPDHVQTHRTTLFAVLALLFAPISLLLPLLLIAAMSPCSWLMLATPNIVAGVIAVTAALVGVPVASWFPAGADLSGFREFELFFNLFFTGFQLFILARETLELPEWLAW